MKLRIAGWLYRLWGWLPLPPWLRWAIVWLGTNKFLIGVAAVVVNERGEVLLFRHTYRGKEPWGLPGGWLKQREDPARAVEREIREESGLEVRALHPVRAAAGPAAGQVDIIFYGQLMGGTFRPSPEVCEAAFFKPDEMPFLPKDIRDITAMVLEGRRWEADQARAAAEPKPQAAATGPHTPSSPHSGPEYR